MWIKQIKHNLGERIKTFCECQGFLKESSTCSDLTHLICLDFFTMSQSENLLSYFPTIENFQSSVQQKPALLGRPFLVIGSGSMLTWNART